MQGSAAYAPEKEALVWKIRNFPGGKEFLLRCKFGLPSVQAEEEAVGRMPPIRVTYEIPYFTVSGIQACCAAAAAAPPPPPPPPPPFPPSCACICSCAFTAGPPLAEYLSRSTNTA